MKVHPLPGFDSLANNVIGGTRGANDAPGGGAVASGKDGKAGVELPSDPDAQYKKELEVLAETRKEEESKTSEEDVKKFYYASVRSWIVMAWIFSNLSLITLVMKAGSVGIITKTVTSEEEVQRKNSDLYLYIILWSVAGLSAFRFVGSVWFLIHRKVCSRNVGCRKLNLLTLRSSLESDHNHNCVSWKSYEDRSEATLCTVYSNVSRGTGIDFHKPACLKSVCTFNLHGKF